MRQGGTQLIAGCRIEVEAKAGARYQLGLAAGEIADPELWALQVGEDADRPPGIALDPPDVLEQLTLLGVAAMAEIEPEHIDPGIEQCPQAFGAGAGRTQGRDDLGAAQSPHDPVS